MDLSINEGTLVVSGGTGDSVQNAIVIKKTPKGLSAEGAEHLFLTQRFGVKGVQWNITQHELLRLGTRVYDCYVIDLIEGGERTLYFEVTEWLARAQSY